MLYFETQTQPLQIFLYLYINKTVFVTYQKGHIMAQFLL